MSYRLKIVEEPFEYQEPEDTEIAEEAFDSYSEWETEENDYEGEAWRGWRIPTFRAPMSGPRVVFIPGILGSVLVDSSMTSAQARDICRKNLGGADTFLRSSPLYPCDKRPETLWGDIGSLHWFFEPNAWEARMRTGNGFDMPGPVRPAGLLDVELQLGRRRFEFKPYTAFVAALRRSGADVLVFPYDWRLSCHHNTGYLQFQIRNRWFGGRFLQPGRRLPESERITFIGHSMGGLLARYLLESPRLGRDLARRLITIGTPQLGSPEAYLHLAGITAPFPDSPYYRLARNLLLMQMVAVGAAARIPKELLPAKTQTVVFRHMASAAQLMPLYDFVVDGGRTEPFAETYRGAVHTGTGRPATAVIQALRQGMVSEAQLGAWTAQHGLDYDFIAATGFPTVTGYDRGRKRVLTGSQGDGTVPLRSAHPAQKTGGRLHHHLLGPGALGHSRLCERRDVQELCLRIMGAQPVSLPVRTASAPSVTSAPSTAEIRDHVAAMKAILERAERASGRENKHRGIVMCHAWLSSVNRQPMMDTTLEPAPGRGQQLKNPPRFVSSPLVEEITLGQDTYRYVWLTGQPGSAYGAGGVVFLPHSGSSTLDVVTLNTGRLDRDWKRACDHGHHAEMQLVGFVQAQRASWKANIGALRVHNRSRQGPRFGYSPCRPCCSELVDLLRALNALPRKMPIAASISWEALYENRLDCQHPTTAECIGNLKANGWGEPQGPRPTGATELPAPVRPTVRRPARVFRT